MADNVQTTLTSAMLAGDTVAIVQSSTGFVVNMIVTVCDVVTSTGKCTTFEHMKVTAVSGNVLTVTRGFAGTSAIGHASGKLITALFDSAHQKVLKDSVIAIETALGPNLSNLPTATTPSLNSVNYNFTPQTPGGSLIIGSNVITLTPCPLGVAGTHTVAANLPHLLYLSGGTGTAEAAPITGGTCTSGATTGTVIVTAANTHSGAWTIKSNTTGAQEAVYAAGATGRVALACSTLDFWGNTASLAALTVPDGYSTSLRGCGGGRNTTIAAHFTTFDWIKYDYVSSGGSVDIGDFDMEPVSNTFPSSGASIRIRYRTYGTVSNVLMGFSYDGLVAEGSNNIYKGLNIFAAHRGVTITCDGVVSCQSQAFLVGSSIMSSANNATAVYVTDTTSGVIIDHSLLAAGGGILPTAGNTTALKIKGSATGPFNEVMIMNGFLDGNTICADIEGNGASYANNSVQILNMHIACSANGVVAKNYVQALRIQNSSIAAVGGTGAGTGSDRSITLLDNVRNVTVLGNTMESDGDGCIVLGGTNATNYDVIGNKCNGGVSVTTSTYALYAPVSVASLKIRDNNFSVSGTSALLTSGGAGMVATNNTGIDDVTPAVATAATLAFPVNPHFTVTGTTGATAVTHPLAAGASGTITATDGPVVFTSGATIGNTFTLKQNVSASWSWDGTKIWLIGLPAPPTDYYLAVSPDTCTMLPATTAFTAGPAMLRAAANNVVLSGTTNVTAGTIAVTCAFDIPTRVTASVGSVIADVSLLYGVQTTALSSIAAATVSSVTYPAAGGAAAGTVASAGGAVTVTPGTLQLTTTTTGQCFNEKLAFGTPIQATTDLRRMTVDQVFTTAGTTATTLQICGVLVHYTAPVY